MYLALTANSNSLLVRLPVCNIGAIPVVGVPLKLHKDDILIAHALANEASVVLLTDHFVNVVWVDIGS